MKAIREACLLALVALGPAVIAIAVHPALADRAQAGLEPDEVRVATVGAWTDEVLWIDARPAEAYAAGRIPEAIHLDPADFDRGLGDVLLSWHPGNPVVVYCDSLSCEASREIAQRLREAGLTDVYYLRGGWDAWIAALESH